jgi:predicted aconitase with swiveling domain
VRPGGDEGKLKLTGRIIYRGRTEGNALVTTQPISFLGGIDPTTGKIIERDHELLGESVKGRVLVFPYGKGSTVGSYTLYRLRKNGMAPSAIVNEECETIVAVGAIISEIPCVDRIDLSKIRPDVRLRLDGATVSF